MRKFFIICGIGIVALPIVGYGLYVWMNSRTFQIFGGLIHHVETSDKVVALTFDDGPSEHIGPDIA